jgi:hypothetical protein
MDDKTKYYLEQSERYHCEREEEAKKHKEIFDDVILGNDQDPQKALDYFYRELRGRESRIELESIDEYGMRDMSNFTREQTWRFVHDNKQVDQLKYYITEIEKLTKQKPAVQGETFGVGTTRDKKNDQEEIYNTPGISAVFLEYPKFKNDLSLLIKHEYINLDGDRLKWKKSKKSLSEYFGNQKKRGENADWKSIELLFDVKGLKNNFSNNGNVYKKQSKDYEKLIELKNTPIGKIGVLMKREYV